MITEKIIEFREQNGVGRPQLNRIEDENCFAHCLHMARKGCLSHAPDWALKDKAEAVAVRPFQNTTVDTVAAILWDQFGNSPPHREVLLKPNISYAIHVNNYQVYMAVRGW